MNTESGEEQNAIKIFRQVCSDFDKAANSSDQGRMPWLGGVSSRFKYFIRHPTKAYMETFIFSITGLSKLNAIEMEMPLEAMLSRLEKYSLQELKALNRICEINLRIHKERLSNNPLFKVTVPIASIYAIIRGAKELFGDSGILSMLKEFIASPFFIEMLDMILVGLVAGLIVMMIQYLIQLLPNLRKSQMLKDIVQIAYENKEAKI